jgi:hypothetical protein
MAVVAWCPENVQKRETHMDTLARGPTVSGKCVLPLPSILLQGADMLWRANIYIYACDGVSQFSYGLQHQGQTHQSGCTSTKCRLASCCLLPQKTRQIVSCLLSSCKSARAKEARKLKTSTRQTNKQHGVGPKNELQPH